MPIQWFPGHMTKALREMEKELKNVDIILYCLDARAPFSCLNPKLHELAKNKKIIYILSKADLVDYSQLSVFISRLETPDCSVIAVNSTQSNSTKPIVNLCKKLLEDKIKFKAELGISYSIKCMVVGVPNVGKSTLINNLCGYAKTETGNRPGVTRGKQWVVTKDGLTLLDTPGTLWPSFKEEKTANNLAYIGSIKEEVLDITELAYSFISDMRVCYKANLQNRYGITILDSDENIDIFDKICISRKCLLKNAELDYDRCAKLIIDDFRKGRLGKIILDK